MKLTCGQLNGLTAEAFADDPAIAGELECFCRFVISKDEKALVVADTKADAEGERAKMARFQFDTLPDGCGKGAKLKLSGMRFVRRAGREYNGKLYHDMVYAFTGCEVLEGGERRQGGGGGWKGGGGGWRKDPEERASIERQSALHDGVKAANTALMLPPEHPMAVTTQAAYDGVVRRVFALGCELLQVGRVPGTEPAGPGQQPGKAATPGADTTPNPAGTPKIPQKSNGAVWLDTLSPKGREIAYKLGELVTEMFGKGNAVMAFEALTAWVNQAGEAVPGLKSVTKVKNEPQAKAIMAKIGPLHHWWKDASTSDRAALADIVFKPGTGPDARWEDIEALKAFGAGQEEEQKPPADSSPDEPVQAAIQADKETWSGFLALCQSATGESEAKAVGLAAAAAVALFGDRYQRSKLRYLTEDAMRQVVDKLREGTLAD